MANFKKKKHKKKTTKNCGLKTGKPSVMFLSLGYFISIAIITTLAFISLELSAFCLGLLALGNYVFYTLRQRTLWELAANYKFKTLEKKHEKLVREIAKNQNILSYLKENINETKDAYLLKNNDFNSKPLTTSNLHSTNHHAQSITMPKAESPQRSQEKITPPVIANEDHFSNYDGLSDMIVRELLHSAIRKKRVDIFIQPIVRLPQRQTRFYEIYGRVRAKAGMYLPAERYMTLAKKDKIINTLDNLVLMECLKTIKDTSHLNKAAPFFINITSSTITNTLFMNRLLGFLSKNRHLAPRIIFEIQQKEFDNMQPAVLEILRGVGKLGCSLSIDHIQTLEFDIKFLQVLKVRFVKINSSILLNNTKNNKTFNDMSRLKRKLECNGIGFIVEHIEDEKAIVELLEYDINYGQGYLFGRPDLQGAYQQKKRA
ncbi:MAG: EAL domain-containing protein [Alphaproteobacteria bacterium]|nr:EAL domain-containing protein [Alphaproteobacteria bacterium]